MYKVTTLTDLKMASRTTNTEKIYYTVDNGGYSYKVVITNNHVKVMYMNEDIDTNDVDLLFKDVPIVCEFNPKNIFVNAQDKEDVGMSLLLELNNNEYVYIGGQSIYSFKIPNKITQFIAELGNSCVVYSYAIDNKGQIYAFSYESNPIMYNPKSKHFSGYKGNKFDIFISPDYPIDIGFVRPESNIIHE